jgi:crossover junction endodeoxyribonuclease RusA
MDIKFPYPDKRLSPNSRTDRRWVTSVRETARQIGFWLVKDAGWKFGGKLPLELTLIVHPPDRRKRDDDNIVSAFKSYRDGMFIALELDDSLVRRLVVERREVEKGGSIYVNLKEIKGENS